MNWICYAFSFRAESGRWHVKIGHTIDAAKREGFLRRHFGNGEMVATSAKFSESDYLAAAACWHPGRDVRGDLSGETFRASPKTARQFFRRADSFDTAGELHWALVDQYDEVPSRTFTVLTGGQAPASVSVSRDRRTFGASDVLRLIIDVDCETVPSAPYGLGDLIQVGGHAGAVSRRLRDSVEVNFGILRRRIHFTTRAAA